MKIGFISKYLPPKIEGVGEYTFHLASALRDLGYDAHIYTDVKQGNLKKEEGEEWIHPVITEWRDRAIAENVAKDGGLDVDVWCLQYVPQMFGKWGLPESITEIGQCLKEKSQSEVVITVHEHGLDWKPGFKDKVLTGLRRGMTRKIFSRVDTVVTTCMRYCDFLNQFIGSSTRVISIPVGANILPEQKSSNSSSEIRKQYDLGESRVMGMFGRLSNFRGYPLAIRSLAFARGLGKDVKLLLMGSVESSNPLLFQELMELASSLKVRDHVISTGILEARELSKCMFMLDLFLFPQEDGISTRNTTCMSALAHGLPIVTYEPVEGNFDDYEFASVIEVERGNESAFMQSVADQFDDKGTGLQSDAEFFKRNFSWPVIAEQYLQILNSSVMRGKR